MTRLLDFLIVAVILGITIAAMLIFGTSSEVSGDDVVFRHDTLTGEIYDGQNTWIPWDTSCCLRAVRLELDSLRMAMEIDSLQRELEER